MQIYNLSEGQIWSHIVTFLSSAIISSVTNLQHHAEIYSFPFNLSSCLNRDGSDMKFTGYPAKNGYPGFKLHVLGCLKYWILPDNGLRKVLILLDIRKSGYPVHSYWNFSYLHTWIETPCYVLYLACCTRIIITRGFVWSIWRYGCMVSDSRW